MNTDHGLKVGDRIRLTGRDWNHYAGTGLRVGDILTIDKAIGKQLYAGEADYVTSSSGSLMNGYEVELVAPEEFELVAPEEVNATVPDYYQFPGGIRVHQISGHLSSFGGQAVQYITRSTRIDGQNKGDSVADLRKAIRFLELEIERLGTDA